MIKNEELVEDVETYKPGYTRSLITPENVVHVNSETLENNQAEVSPDKQMIGPEEIFSIPVKKAKKSTRGRKATDATLVTSSPYKNHLAEFVEKQKAKNEPTKRKTDVMPLMKDERKKKQCKALGDNDLCDEDKANATEHHLAEFVL